MTRPLAINLTRTLTFTLALAVLAGPLVAPSQSHGQPPPPPPPRDAQVYAVTLHPAAAPVPALKYQLLPLASELQPGNAVPVYYRAFSPEWWGFVSRDAKIHEKEDRASKQTLSEFKNNQELAFVKGWASLKEVDRAARRTYAEWDYLPRLREEGFKMLLPDIQGFRYFARLLHFRARYELAGGDYAQATATTATMLAMSRHVNDAGLLISHLVSIAIASVALDTVREAVQQPDAPNLYWALTDLPSPFLDLRRTLDGEREAIFGSLPELRDLLAGKVDRLDDQKLRQRLAQILPQFAGKPNRAGADEANPPSLQLLAWAMVNYPSAKQTLLSDGMEPARVEKLSVLQACMLVEVRNYRRQLDELFKWANLPYWQAIKGLRQAERQLAQELLVGRNNLLVSSLLPSLERVLYARARLDRQIAMLRVIEALRLHAASNDGQWPDSLDAITLVPIPNDPLTGKAFEYTRQRDRATLRANPPPGEAPSQLYAIRYEITFKQ
jgi:hypothetical protein